MLDDSVWYTEPDRKCDNEFIQVNHNLLHVLRSRRIETGMEEMCDRLINNGLRQLCFVIRYDVSDKDLLPQWWYVGYCWAAGA